MLAAAVRRYLLGPAAPHLYDVAGTLHTGDVLVVEPPDEPAYVALVIASHSFGVMLATPARHRSRELLALNRLPDNEHFLLVLLGNLVDCAAPRTFASVRALALEHTRTLVGAIVNAVSAVRSFAPDVRGHRPVDDAAPDVAAALSSSFFGLAVFEHADVLGERERPMCEYDVDEWLDGGAVERALPLGDSLLVRVDDPNKLLA